MDGINQIHSNLGQAARFGFFKERLFLQLRNQII
jgi:hypothetical protein